MLLDYGKMDATALRRKAEAAAGERLQLRLRSGARPGQPEAREQVRRKVVKCSYQCFEQGTAA